MSNTYLDFDYNLMKHLHALFSSHTVSEAAVRAGVTQPAMSRSLKKINDLFGEKLFITGKQGIKPTAKAEAIRKEVHKIISMTNALIEQEKAFEPNSSTKTFNIYCSEIMQTHLSKNIIGIIEENGYTIKINLKPISSAKRLESTNQSETVDLILAGEIIPINDLKVKKVLSSQYRFFSNREQLKRKNKLYLSLNISGSEENDSQIDKYFKMRNIARETFTCYSLSQLKSILESTPNTCAVLPVFLKPFFNSQIIKSSSFLSEIELNYYIHWKEVDDSSPANKWLRNFITSNFK